MGDTFTDEWQDQVPEKFTGKSGNWQFTKLYNTKWEGNKYDFRLSEDSPSYIRMWSRSPGRINLDGEVILNLGILSIHLRSRDDSWAKETNTYTTALKWDSVEEALLALDQKFSEVLALAKPLADALNSDNSWEAKDFPD